MGCRVIEGAREGMSDADLEGEWVDRQKSMLRMGPGTRSQRVYLSRRFCLNYHLSSAMLSTFIDSPWLFSPTCNKQTFDRS